MFVGGTDGEKVMVIRDENSKLLNVKLRELNVMNMTSSLNRTVRPLFPKS